MQTGSAPPGEDSHDSGYSIDEAGRRELQALKARLGDRNRHIQPDSDGDDGACPPDTKGGLNKKASQPKHQLLQQVWPEQQHLWQASERRLGQQQAHQQAWQHNGSACPPVGAAAAASSGEEAVGSDSEWEASSSDYVSDSDDEQQLSPANFGPFDGLLSKMLGATRNAAHPVTKQRSAAAGKKPSATGHKGRAIAAKPPQRARQTPQQRKRRKKALEEEVGGLLGMDGLGGSVLYSFLDEADLQEQQQPQKQLKPQAAAGKQSVKQHQRQRQQTLGPTEGCEDTDGGGSELLDEDDEDIDALLLPPNQAGHLDDDMHDANALAELESILRQFQQKAAMLKAARSLLDAGTAAEGTKAAAAATNLQAAAGRSRTAAAARGRATSAGGCGPHSQAAAHMQQLQQQRNMQQQQQHVAGRKPKLAHRKGAGSRHRAGAAADKDSSVAAAAAAAGGLDVAADADALLSEMPDGVLFGHTADADELQLASAAAGLDNGFSTAGVVHAAADAARKGRGRSSRGSSRRSITAKSKGKMQQLQVNMLQQQQEVTSFASEVPGDADPTAAPVLADEVEPAAAPVAEAAREPQPHSSWAPIGLGKWRERLRVMQTALEANRELQGDLGQLLCGTEKAIADNYAMQCRVTIAERARRIGLPMAGALAELTAAAAADGAVVAARADPSTCTPGSAGGRAAGQPSSADAAAAADDDELWSKQQQSYTRRKPNKAGIQDGQESEGDISALNGASDGDEVDDDKDIDIDDLMQEEDELGGSGASTVVPYCRPHRRYVRQEPRPRTLLAFAAAPTLGPNKPLLRSAYWSTPWGDTAPLPPGGKKLLAEGGQLVNRLWAARLGKWKSSEEHQLREGVRSAAIKILYTQELQTLEAAEPGPNLLLQLKERTEALRNAQLEEPRIRTAVDNFTKADWDQLAADLNCGRSGVELQRHWMCHLSAVALEPWSSEELMELSELVKQYGTTNWVLIAQELGTNRPPGVVVKQWVKQCQPGPMSASITARTSLHQQLLLQHREQLQMLVDAGKKQQESEVKHAAAAAGGPDGSPRLLQQQPQGGIQVVPTGGADSAAAEFDTESAQCMLLELMVEHGKNWKLISGMMGKTVKQVRGMYEHMTKNINRRLGPWTPMEDIRLLQAVEMHGTKWTDIFALNLVPGRTVRQLKERFLRVTRPEIDHSPLTAEEIVLLAAHAAQHEASFGVVRYDKLAQELFKGKRTAHKLRSIWSMYKTAKGDVSAVVARQQLAFVKKLKQMYGNSVEPSAAQPAAAAEQWMQDGTVQVQQPSVTLEQAEQQQQQRPALLPSASATATLRRKQRDMCAVTSEILLPVSTGAAAAVSVSAPAVGGSGPRSVSAAAPGTATTVAAAADGEALLAAAAPTTGQAVDGRPLSASPAVPCDKQAILPTAATVQQQQQRPQAPNTVLRLAGAGISTTKQKSVVWCIEDILHVFPDSYTVKPPAGGVYRVSWDGYAASPEPRTSARTLYVALPDRMVLPSPQQHDAYWAWLEERYTEQAAWRQVMLARLGQLPATAGMSATTTATATASVAASAVSGTLQQQQQQEVAGTKRQAADGITAAAEGTLGSAAHCSAADGRIGANTLAPKSAAAAASLKRPLPAHSPESVSAARPMAAVMPPAGAASHPLPAQTQAAAAELPPLPKLRKVDSDGKNTKHGYRMTPAPGAYEATAAKRQQQRALDHQKVQILMQHSGMAPPPQQQQRSSSVSPGETYPHNPAAAAAAAAQCSNTAQMSAIHSQRCSQVHLQSQAIAPAQNQRQQHMLARLVAQQQSPALASFVSPRFVVAEWSRSATPVLGHPGRLNVCQLQQQQLPPQLHSHQSFAAAEAAAVAASDGMLAGQSLSRINSNAGLAAAVDTPQAPQQADAEQLMGAGGGDAGVNRAAASAEADANFVAAAAPATAAQGPDPDSLDDLVDLDSDGLLDNCLFNALDKQRTPAAAADIAAMQDAAAEGALSAGSGRPASAAAGGGGSSAIVLPLPATTFSPVAPPVSLPAVPPVPHPAAHTPVVVSAAPAVQSVTVGLGHVAAASGGFAGLQQGAATTSLPSTFALAIPDQHPENLLFPLPGQDPVRDAIMVPFVAWAFGSDGQPGELTYTQALKQQLEAGLAELQAAAPTADGVQHAAPAGGAAAAATDSAAEHTDSLVDAAASSAATAAAATQRTKHKAVRRHRWEDITDWSDIDDNGDGLPARAAGRKTQRRGPRRLDRLPQRVGMVTSASILLTAVTTLLQLLPTPQHYGLFLQWAEQTGQHVEYADFTVEGLKVGAKMYNACQRDKQQLLPLGRVATAAGAAAVRSVGGSTAAAQRAGRSTGSRKRKEAAAEILPTSAAAAPDFTEERPKRQRKSIYDKSQLAARKAACTSAAAANCGMAVVAAAVPAANDSPGVEDLMDAQSAGTRIRTTQTSANKGSNQAKRRRSAATERFSSDHVHDSIVWGKTPACSGDMLGAVLSNTGATAGQQHHLKAGEAAAAAASHDAAAVTESLQQQQQQQQQQPEQAADVEAACVSKSQHCNQQAGQQVQQQQQQQQPEQAADVEAACVTKSQHCNQQPGQQVQQQQQQLEGNIKLLRRSQRRQIKSQKSGASSRTEGASP